MRVMVFGTFDLLHPGHLSLLRAAEAQGELTVVVARTSTVHKIKGRDPLQSECKRVKNIEELFPLATVVLGDKVDFLAPVRAHRPELILLGYDQRLPPGIRKEDLPCRIKRAPALSPEKYKSSVLAKAHRKMVDRKPEK